MQRILYKILLYLLRSLIYIKRAVVWLFEKLTSIGGKILQIYRQNLGFRFYKVTDLIKKILRRVGINWEGGWVNLLGQRGTLQLVLLIVAVVVMIPHSKLYTRESQTVAGRDTLLYQFVGPGEYDFEIEEIEIDVSELAQRDTRSWREGAVVSEVPGGSGVATKIEPQEISSITAGGAAVAKPTILPGVELPTTEGASKRSEIVYYEVQPGDIIGKIAEQHDLNVVTILWANNLSVRSYIRPGDKLVILPADGVLHKVARGDTVSKIAKVYSAEAEDVIKVNRLQEGGKDIVVGEELFVPGGEKPRPQYVAPRVQSSFSSISAPPPSVTAPAGSGYLWPSNVRRITQYYGWRHTGLDIGGPSGSPLYASKAGTVTRSSCGWNGGYGCYIIIDHGGGVQTLYAHNSRNYVSVGNQVVQGQTIALMGSTGRSTGPHIHFEVRLNGRRQNPLKYIR